jgi:transaldolase
MRPAKRETNDFARGILTEILDRPISLEVFADEFTEMERQARKIASWGENVYVKVPITNTKGKPSLLLIRSLSKAGIKLNVTAITTLNQVKQAVSALEESPGVFVVSDSRFSHECRISREALDQRILV